MPTSAQLMITFPTSKMPLPPIEEVRRILKAVDGELSDDTLKERYEKWR